MQCIAIHIQFLYILKYDTELLTILVKRRVIVNYFSETSKLKAQSKIENANITSSFIVGNIEEQDIPALKKEKGLIVEVLQRKDPVITSRIFENEDSNLVGDDHPKPSPTPPTTLRQDETNFFIVELDGPLLKEWKKILNDLGVNLISSVAYRKYLVKVTPIQRDNLQNLDFVKSIFTYDTSYKRIADDPSYALPRPENPTEEEGLHKSKYYAILHDRNDLQKTVNWFLSKNVDVVAAHNEVVTFITKHNPTLLEECRQLPEISEIQPDIQGHTANYIARELLHVDVNDSNGAISTNFSDGDGQIIGVVDYGLDKEHPDFQGRIVSVVREINDYRPNDTNDYDGHGTHVAGSILGDGTKSNQKIRGIVPKAKLFFQSVGVEDRQVKMPDNEKALFELCDRAYNVGVRLSNHSWGSPCTSQYYITARLFDKYVLEHPDFLFVVAAGNDGKAVSIQGGQIGNPKHSKKGFVDWYSIRSPGTCKNGLTVGATRSSRTDGPNKDQKWGLSEEINDYNGMPYKPFPDSPISDEIMCGDSESMAAFSSRGPVQPKRIKPDLVAPGTDILSTRSSLDAKQNFENAFYVYRSGTSMSTPMVTGCAALVRDHYLKKKNHNPSASLIKATLVNGTRWLAGSDAIADHNKIPNYHQGFGMIDMIQTLPNDKSPNLRLEFIDTWIYPDSTRKIRETGSLKIYRLVTQDSKALRICMAYIDRPSAGLENNLNLFLYNTETEEVFRGNEQILTDIDIEHIGDPYNNVEIIRIVNPSDGSYEIRVEGSNLIDENLDFALVVTGENISWLEEIQ